MSSATASTSITSQIWQRVVRQGDTNGDNSLSKDEFEALRAGFKDSADLDQIIRSFDTNGDGSLSSSELPSAQLDDEMLKPMLSWQEYEKADAATRAEDDNRDVNALFKRADVDGDGFLSWRELIADIALNETRRLEGKPASPSFLLRKDANRDHLSRDDFIFVRIRVGDPTVHALPPVKVSSEASEAARKAMEEYKSSPSYQKPRTEEELRQMRVGYVLNTPLNATYISRLLSQLSAAIAKNDPTNTPGSGMGGTVA